MLPEGILPTWFDQLGLMAWPLFVCSIISIAISIERLVFLIKIKLHSRETFKRLYDFLLSHQHQPKPLRDELVALKLNELQPSYFSGINLLRMIGTISPMLGLTGTILGIISAFQVIAAHTGPVTPNIIAEGLWEAMLTTAVGLLIAVPSLLLAYIFRQIAQQELDEFCRCLNSVSTWFEVNNSYREKLEENGDMHPMLKMMKKSLKPISTYS